MSPSDDELRTLWAAVDAYWRPVIDLCHRRSLDSRVAVDDGETRFMSEWSTFLMIPEEGYLEFSPDPVPIRHVQWVDLCTVSLETFAGEVRPKQLEGLRTEPELQGRSVSVRKTWRADLSLEFDALRVANPFFGVPRRSS